MGSTMFTTNNSAMPAGGFFGSTATSTTPAGLFGSTPASTTPAAAGGGFFGSAPSASTTPIGGCFGSAPAAAGGGFFGSTPASTTPAAGGGLFSSTPVSTTPAAGGGLFSSTPASTTPAAAGGGLFSSTPPASTTPAAAGGGLFSSTPFSSTPASSAATPGGGSAPDPLSKLSSNIQSEVHKRLKADFSDASILYLHDKLALHWLSKGVAGGQLSDSFALFQVVNQMNIQLHGVCHGAACYNMACCLSVAARENQLALLQSMLVESPSSLSALVEKALDAAARWLLAGVSFGWHNTAHTASDPDLSLLRERRPQAVSAAQSLASVLGGVGGGMPCTTSSTDASLHPPCVSFGKQPHQIA